jgi:hypothetical protein
MEWLSILNGKAGLPVGAPITTTISRPVVGANSLGATLGANDLLISSGDPQVPYTIPAFLPAVTQKAIQLLIQATLLAVQLQLLQLSTLA